MFRLLLTSMAILVLASCKMDMKVDTPSSRSNSSSDTGILTAGIRMIPIQTPAGNFHVWTKKFGDNPKLKVLLLHGGPAMGHEYLECFESYFPPEGIEFYEYDQLGSSYSD